MPRIALKGLATLTFAGQGEFTGQGYISQREDGRLNASVACDGTPFQGGSDPWNLPPDSFRLTCPDGKEGRTTTWMTTNTTHDLTPSSTRVAISGILSQFSVSHPVVSPETASFRFRFFLTNLDFLGTELTVRKNRNGRTTTRNKITLNLDPDKMTLRWLPSYDRLIQELKATSGTMATAQLTINANSPTLNQTIIDRVEDVCILLSLGAGNQVTWIEMREYSASTNVKIRLVDEVQNGA